MNIKYEEICDWSVSRYSQSDLQGQITQNMKVHHSLALVCQTCMERITRKSMATVNGLVANILQNIFFSVQQVWNGVRASE